MTRMTMTTIMKMMGATNDDAIMGIFYFFIIIF
jgi:hypothetical protein